MASSCSILKGMPGKDICTELHEWARSLPRHSFPFDISTIPKNGIYFLFEKGERAHGGLRLVRVGTHTGMNQLPSRLLQHFVNENKDRSIFRKNIGRALLHKARDPFLPLWEIDLTPADARKKHGGAVYYAKQKGIERKITQTLQKNFQFAVVQVDDPKKRLALESKIISTLSHCAKCTPSSKWLGLNSPKTKIRESGLWLVNELYKTPLSGKDLSALKSLYT